MHPNISFQVSSKNIDEVLLLLRKELEVSQPWRLRSDLAQP
jgi:hypothetical protein